MRRKPRLKTQKRGKKGLERKRRKRKVGVERVGKTQGREDRKPMPRTGDRKVKRSEKTEAKAEGRKVQKTERKKEPAAKGRNG